MTHFSQLKSYHRPNMPLTSIPFHGILKASLPTCVLETSMRSRLSLLDLPQRTMKPLLARQREVARRLTLGEKQKDIAPELGYTPQAISYMKRKNPAFQEHLEDLQEAKDNEVISLRNKVSAGASAGLDILVKILTPRTEEHQKADLKTKVRVAQDLLDRDGRAPRTTASKISGQHLHAVLSVEDIEEIKQAAAERRQGVVQIVPQSGDM